MDRGDRALPQGCVPRSGLLWRDNGITVRVGQLKSDMFKTATLLLAFNLFLSRYPLVGGESSFAMQAAVAAAH